MKKRFKQLLTKKKIGPFSWHWYVFVAIVIFGIYLRFYRIEYIQSFGWDQARDSWVVRDIILGKYTLIGPRTGIGHFHLGPVYYYLLVPFFWLFKLDPMASNYFNILANIANFIAIFYVAKKFFSKYTAVFIIFIYAINPYLIQINRTPWNVTMVSGFSVMIFYGLYQVYKGFYKWTVVVSVLSGFFFNLHLSAVFFPPIIVFATLLTPHKKKVLFWYLYSIPLYFIWFIPNILSESVKKTGDYFKVTDFMRDYVMSFHLRFFLHRLPDGLIQFQKILHFPVLEIGRYIVPILFGLSIVLREKSSEKKFFAYLVFLWIGVPLIGFTFYSGPISEYYFLMSAPIVLFVIAYLQNRLLSLNRKLLLLPVIILWSVYAFFTVQENWTKPTSGGLAKQKDEARANVLRRELIPYNEGDIKSYLYEVWVEEEKRK